jgi:Protein of unknown function (DUF3302)
MGWQTQSSEELLYALTFAIVYGLAFAAVWALHSLGAWPGRIARSRRHPKATAIGVCGWLGLPVLVLWPIALAWAYTTPKQRLRHTPAAPTPGLYETDIDALAADLRETSEQIAALESRLGVHATKRVA